MEPNLEIIKLIFINKRVMTFSASDYIKLRKEHRILGKLIGVAPPQPRNVNLFHLPANFSEYETRLMIEENIAILEEKSELENQPTKQMKSDYDSHKERVIEEIQKPYIENKMKMVKSNMEQIIKGKRKKLLKMGTLESGKLKMCELPIK